jgi:serine/threonine protein kinase
LGHRLPTPRPNGRKGGLSAPTNPIYLTALSVIPERRYQKKRLSSPPSWIAGWRAVDSRLGRPVAIKVATRQFSGRFEREARAISTLNHPHICTLYDIGPNYLVMELVEGETLAALLKKGPVPVGLAIRYCDQIADALAAAHARGVVHRDRWASGQ